MPNSPKKIKRSHRGKNSKYTRDLHFRVTPHDHDLVHSVARQHGITATALIFQQIKEIKRKRRENAPKSLLRDLSPVIPEHSCYKLPVLRYIYLEAGGIVAQGIIFDGVQEEQYLILSRTNGGKRWVWVHEVPEHDERRLLWSATKA